MQVWPASRPRMLAGRVTDLSSSAWVDVAFPAGVFTSPPRVVASLAGTGGSGSLPIIRVANPTTTEGFRISVVSGSGYSADWIAMQP